MGRKSNKQKEIEYKELKEVAINFIIRRGYNLWKRNGKFDNKIPQKMPIEAVKFILDDYIEKVKQAKKYSLSA